MAFMPPQRGSLLKPRPGKKWASLGGSASPTTPLNSQPNDALNQLHVVFQDLAGGIDEREISASAASPIDASFLELCERAAAAIEEAATVAAAPVLQLVRSAFGSEGTLANVLCDALESEVRHIIRAGEQGHIPSQHGPPAIPAIVQLLRSLVAVTRLASYTLDPEHEGAASSESERPDQLIELLPRRMVAILVNVAEKGVRVVQEGRWIELKRYVFPVFELLSSSFFIGAALGALAKMVHQRLATPMLSDDSVDIREARGLGDRASSASPVPPPASQWLYKAGCLAEELLDHAEEGLVSESTRLEVQHAQDAAWDAIIRIHNQRKEDEIQSDGVQDAEAVADPEDGATRRRPSRATRARRPAAVPSAVAGTRKAHTAAYPSESEASAPPPESALEAPARSRPCALQEPEATGGDDEAQTDKSLCVPPEADSTVADIPDGDSTFVTAVGLDVRDTMGILLSFLVDLFGGARVLLARVGVVLEAQVQRLVDLSRSIAAEGDVDSGEEDALAEMKSASDAEQALKLCQGKIRASMWVVNEILKLQDVELVADEFVPPLVRCALLAIYLPAELRPELRPIHQTLLGPSIVQYTAAELWSLVEASVQASPPPRREWVYTAGCLAEETMEALQGMPTPCPPVLLEMMRNVRFTARAHLAWVAFHEDPAINERGHRSRKRERADGAEGEAEGSSNGSYESDEEETNTEDEEGEEHSDDNGSSLDDFISVSGEHNQFGFLRMVQDVDYYKNMQEKVDSAGGGTVTVQAHFQTRLMDDWQPHYRQLLEMHPDPIEPEEPMPESCDATAAGAVESRLGFEPSPEPPDLTCRSNEAAASRLYAEPSEGKGRRRASSVAGDSHSRGSGRKRRCHG